MELAEQSFRLLDLHDVDLNKLKPEKLECNQCESLKIPKMEENATNCTGGLFMPAQTDLSRVAFAKG